ncbi:hypothetical protein B0H11DRAFT_2067324 [Mycena galericulata]|nr:hypothetical protein B0H11DRAFT_2067324 [Mycena galericulata]
MAMSKSDRRARFDELNNGIPLLRRQLEELERERNEIFKSLTFPILTLPPEITSEIFLHCLPVPEQHKPRVSDAPLLLTCICRPWRTIALSTPRLWSTFYFPADAPISEARDRFISDWLARSGHCALSISLFHWYSESDDDPYDGEDREQLIANSIRTCLQLFARHSSRWGRVELVFRPSILQSVSASVFEGGLPQLVHLALGCRDHSDFMFGSSEMNLFNVAPRLRSVELWLDRGDTIDIHLISLPWAQLTSFTGHCFMESECFYVLAQCPALVKCNFVLCVGEASMEAIPDLAPINALQSLTAMVPDSLSRIFTGLTVPRLETLNIESHIHLVPQLLTRSHCTFTNSATI